MIKHIQGKGYAVFSHRTKKRLSRFYRTKKQAQKRLRQIQFFKYVKRRKKF